MYIGDLVKKYIYAYVFVDICINILNFARSIFGNQSVRNIATTSPRPSPFPVNANNPCRLYVSFRDIPKMIYT